MASSFVEEDERDRERMPSSSGEDSEDEVNCERCASSELRRKMSPQELADWKTRDDLADQYPMAGGRILRLNRISKAHLVYGQLIPAFPPSPRFSANFC